uniref:Uncharacterized protein n=1 Tax=Manihot esculenta TaxID=3983 RepID=A0A2C9U6H8_MANES
MPMGPFLCPSYVTIIHMDVAQLFTCWIFFPLLFLFSSCCMQC